ncbi:MAG TPA: acyl-CoA dehydrogenase family protein [Candidatus Dormibacteraeota bacterium]
MDLGLSPDQLEIQRAVREACARFDDAYWREVDERLAYPDEFVRAMTDQGWLGMLIPERYGGGGQGMTEAAIVLEEINRSGGNGTACHAQMYTMGTVLRHGSEEQKQRYLPGIASGELRLQAFGVTEPDAGSDTTKIATMAVRRGDRYVVNGQKVFTSRVENSDLMLLLARTSPVPERVEDRTRGLSVFLVDLRQARGHFEYQRMDIMFNHHTYQCFFNDLEVPVENLVGEEGRGFRYIIDGWNAERILIASEAIGDGHWFVQRAARYASGRELFGGPVGANQGVQFPIAQAYAQVEAASLVRYQAAALFDAGQPCGAQANMAKLLASQASWAAANACLTAHGGYGFAREYDVERKFRETKLFEIAPVSNNLVLAYLGQRVLGMPRSY